MFVPLPPGQCWQVNTFYIYLAQVLHLNFDRMWGCERNLSKALLMSVYWWLAANFIKNYVKGEKCPKTF